MPSPPVFSSQFGEDRFILEQGFAPRRGTFVDVGAGDPVRFSNTYCFERLGWSGLCVDADPTQVEALRDARTCAVEWAAVGAGSTEIDFLHCEDPDYSTTLDHLPELAAAKGWAVRATRVPLVPLETLLIRHEIGRIDLLSIDTEGTELDVCSTLDWERRRPRLVVIEYLTDGRPTQEAEVRAYFAELPYRLVHRTYCNLVYAETSAPRLLRGLARRVRARRSLRRPS